jgi:hypothetical protein
MKKLSIIFIIFIAFACQKTVHENEVLNEVQSNNEFKRCASQEVLEKQLAEDPAFKERLQDIERFTRQYINSDEAQRSNARAINIPVIVHVVWNTPEQNISDAQINAQLAVLNEDFNLRNKDNNSVPSHFRDLKANVGISFLLDRVVRVQTSKRQFGFDDGVKYTQRGGSDAIETNKYLNMWVCNLGQNLLGYAQFPGGKAETDGVVILYSSFGSIDKNRTGAYIPNYNLGRTATHEVGHYLNLRHIWGDATCGNDFVDDTPLHNTANYRCPSFDERSTCTGTPLEMWMNYMDYTYDRCMYMFTQGQSTRMHAILASGGARASVVN